MPHLFTERSIAVLNYCALTQYFRHIGWWSACKLALLVALAWSPGLQATRPRIWAHGCLWIIIFIPQNCKFSNEVTKHDFDYNIKLRGTTGTLTYQFFLKSIDLKVPNLITPLTLKYRETHGCVVSIVATDALVLKHQAISIHNADWTLLVLDQFHIKKILHIRWTASCVENFIMHTPIHTWFIITKMKVYGNSVVFSPCICCFYFRFMYLF